METASLLGGVEGRRPWTRARSSFGSRSRVLTPRTCSRSCPSSPGHATASRRSATAGESRRCSSGTARSSSRRSETTHVPARRQPRVERITGQRRRGGDRLPSAPGVRGGLACGPLRLPDGPQLGSHAKTQRRRSSSPSLCPARASSRFGPARAARRRASTSSACARARSRPPHPGHTRPTGAGRLDPSGPARAIRTISRCRTTSIAPGPCSPRPDIRTVADCPSCGCSHADFGFSETHRRGEEARWQQWAELGVRLRQEWREWADRARFRHPIRSTPISGSGGGTRTTPIRTGCSGRCSRRCRYSRDAETRSSARPARPLTPLQGRPPRALPRGRPAARRRAGVDRARRTTDSISLCFIARGSRASGRARSPSRR